MAHIFTLLKHKFAFHSSGLIIKKYTKMGRLYIPLNISVQMGKLFLIYKGKIECDYLLTAIFKFSSVKKLKF